MILAAGHGLHLPTDLPVALLTAGVLLWLGLLISKRVAGHDSYPTLYKVMAWSVVLHLACAPMQIFVVDHLYAGVADWLRYDHQGALFADQIRHGHFTLRGTNIGQKFVNDGSISLVGGLIMTVTGPNQLAAFFASSWLAFAGTVFFYKAFSVTFPGVDRRFYAWLIFLFPSILFWTADVGKEADMLFALGLTAYGMAQILVRIKRGYLYALIGGVLGILIRPNELLLLVGGFAIAMVVRAFGGGQLAGEARRSRSAFASIGTFVFVVAGVVFVGFATVHLLHGVTSKNGSLAATLTSLNKSNTGAAAGFGSSNFSYSPNPLTYPRDVFNVLFNPLWFNARSLSQIVQSVENSLILGVIIYSLRRLRYLFRAGVQRPFVLMALFYSLVWCYAFAALGNLGLVTRERTLLLPFLFVMLAIPVARPGERPYPWQVRRAKHKKARLGPGPDERVPDDPVVHAMGTVQWESRYADGAHTDWSATDWRGDL